ncbi:MAG: hypothetical protein JW967_02685 [Dehalococcoidales bacterium]|nr:hypothetical protein [Dehalococcoidales bacterium]
MSKSVRKWEFIGIAVISIVGSFLHFLFELAGKWAPVGAIAAVNESVWEHFKIGFWAAAFYLIFEYFYLNKSFRNFFFAKAIGIYSIPAVIALIFYSYTAILGHEILAVDILTFIIAIAVSQLISYRLSTIMILPAWLNSLGLALIIIMAAAFIVFTYLPPHLAVFLDSVTGKYGIP